MKKTVLFVIVFLVFQILHVQGQRIPLVKMTQDSIVTEIVGNKFVVSNKKMGEGRHTLSFSKPASGIYTIGMKINDAAYEKKITVK